MSREPLPSWLKPDALVEIEDSEVTYRLWVATVSQCLDDHVVVVFEVPPGQPTPKEVLHINSPRLHPLFWGGRQGLPWKYYPPSCVPFGKTEQNLAKHLGSVQEKDFTKLRSEIPVWKPPPVHFLDVGQWVEVIDPPSQAFITAALVSEVTPDRHFFVLTGHGWRRVFNIHDPSVLPPDWAFRHGKPLRLPPNLLVTVSGVHSAGDLFSWKRVRDRLKDLGRKSPTPASREAFVEWQSAAIAYRPGQAVLVVDPADREQRVPGLITAIHGHLVTVTLTLKGSSRGPRSLLFPALSHSLISTADATRRGISIRQPPLNPSPPRLTPAPSSSSSSPPQRKTSLSPPGSPPKKSPHLRKTAPPVILYFNKTCATGPNIIRAQFVHAPETVNDPAVKEVVRSALRLLLAACSNRPQFLARLAPDSPSQPSVGVALEGEDFRFRSCQGRSELRDFFRWVCRQLGACPNLVSPLPVPDRHACPDACFRRGIGRPRRSPNGPSKNKGGKGKAGTSTPPKGETQTRKAKRKIQETQGDGDAKRKRLSPPERGSEKGPPAGKEEATAEPLVHPPDQGSAPTTAKPKSATSKSKPHGATAKPSSSTVKPSSSSVKPSSSAVDSPPSTIKVSSSTVKPESPPSTAEPGAPTAKPETPSATVKPSLPTAKPQPSTVALAIAKHPQAPTKQPRPVSGVTRPVINADGEAERVPGKKGPPPIPITIECLDAVTSDPRVWTAADVAKFLQGTANCSQFADLVLREDICGPSFMLLNLPIAKGPLGLPHTAAIALLTHAASLKFTCFKKFVSGD